MELRPGDALGARVRVRRGEVMSVPSVRAIYRSHLQQNTPDNCPCQTQFLDILPDEVLKSQVGEYLAVEVIVSTRGVSALRGKRLHLLQTHAVVGVGN